MTEQHGKNAVKITVTYEDGTTQEVKKGLVWCLTELPESDRVEITADMVSISGKDLYTIVQAAVELGMRLGMFG